MRSFAVVAGFAAAVNAYAYPAYNATSSVAPPSYESSKAPEYPAYPASSSVGYPSYPVSSKAPEYGYTVTTVKTLSTVCATPTTLKVGTKTYTVTKSTTIIDNDCEYTTTVPVKSTPAPVKPSSAPVVKVSSVYTPPVVSSKPVVVPYPSKNGTAPTTPVATGVPTSTKPTPSQFTGAAAQTGAAMLAIVGAVAAFL